MALHHAEMLYAQRTGTLTLEQGTYYQERLARFQKMYLAAIKALAQLRREAVTVTHVQGLDGQQLDAARAGGERPRALSGPHGVVAPPVRAPPWGRGGGHGSRPGES